MYRDPRFFQHFSPFTARNGKPPTLLQKIAAVLVTIVLFGFALMASVVLFAVVLCLGAIGWGYFWWKTRKLRREMRNRAGAARQTSDGSTVVIEGEVIRVVEASAEGQERPRGSD